MKKVIYQTENNEILFKEYANVFDIPRKDEYIVYLKQYWVVKSIWHNFDKNHIEVTVENFN